MLKKINWIFRKTHITFSPFILYINNKWEGWGFEIFSFSIGLKDYSLLKLTWHLPNGAEKKLSFSGDFLFLRNPFLNELVNLGDRVMWLLPLSKWDEFKFWVLKLIFR